MEKLFSQQYIGGDIMKVVPKAFAYEEKVNNIAYRWINKLDNGIISDPTQFKLECKEVDVDPSDVILVLSIIQYL